MRITENRLKNVIRRIISEMSQLELDHNVGAGFGSNMLSFMDKAKACCTMSTAELFDMCAQICAQNSSMSKHCAELCACACRDRIDQSTLEDCCKCLSKICKCTDCSAICRTCCGC